MTNAILDSLQSRAAEHPDAIAISGDGDTVSYGELWRRVTRASDWLRSQSMSRAALWGENSVDWIVADLAAWKAGVTVVPLPSFFSAAQLQHVIECSGVGGVIVCGDAPGPVPAQGSTAGPGRGLRLELIAPSQRAVPVAAGVCKITFTSGTTGEPKGVCLDTPMLEAVTRALAARIHAAPGMAEAIGAHFTLLPLSTLLENIAGLYVPLMLGKRVVVRASADVGLAGSSRLDVVRLLQALHAEQPNSLILLPQILHALVVAAGRGLPPPESLRFVAVGGAHTPVALLERARAVGLPVFEGYGLSECASVVALNAPGDERRGSVGRPLDHVRVRVRDGVIEVAGNTFAGYLGQPPWPRDAWLDTGDLGHLDSDGFLHVTGRRNNILISSFGRNVSPEWVEGELSLCASIDQAMVVGDAQPFLCAIVVPARGADATTIEHDVDGVNASLPDYARVRRFLVAAEPFTTANGLLTDNGRLRRGAIAARHAAAIASLYAELPSPTPMEAMHEFL